jgi:hypothetical protein
VFVNHLCEAKGEQDGEANKARECFAEFVIPSSDSPVAFDLLEEGFHPMTTPVEPLQRMLRRSSVNEAREYRF